MEPRPVAGLGDVLLFVLASISFCLVRSARTLEPILATSIL